MHATTLLLAFAAVVIATPTTNSLNLARADDHRIYKSSDGKGNIDIYLSDDKINWGDKAPKDWVDKLDCDAAHCEDISGKTKVKPDDEPIEEEYTISIKLSENYDPKVLDDFKKALRATLDKSTDKKTEKYYSHTCGGMGFCETTEEEIDQYWAPKAINIRDEKSSSNLQLEVSTKAPNGGAFCEGATDIGSAIAGAVNGAASAAFAVAGVFCGLLD